MSEKNEKITVKKTVETPKKTTSEPKFTLEKLRENSAVLFNVSSSVFDGAAYGLNGEYTVSEMKKIIEKWKSKEVK